MSSKVRSFKWLIGMLRPYWRQALLALILSALTITGNIGLMAASAYLLARAALHPPVLDLMTTIVGVRFFGLFRAVSRYFERYVSHDVTFKMLSRIRVAFYQKLQPLAPARLLNYQSGDLLGRIVADVETQQNLFLKVLAPPISALLVLVIYGLFLARYDVRFTVILAASFLLAGLGVPWGIKIFGDGIASQMKSLKSVLNIQISDCLLGMSEIIAYGQVQSRLSRVRLIDQELMHRQRRYIGLSALSSALVGMIANIGMWLVLILGIVLAEQKRLSGVDLGMLALGCFSSFEVLFPLGLVPYHLEQNLTAADRLLEIIDAEPAVKECAARSFVPEGFDLVFQDISFKYGQNEPWTFKHLSFRIPEKSKVAVVGPSGAGKTSMVNLLLRFWEYNEGQIFLGGHSLREYSLEDVRSFLGVVTQRTHIFNATIRENLLMAKPQATDEELIKACRQAKLHNYILSLPQGYDSFVGEGGFKLSGGQRQRLAIARVFLKNAPIIIFDEATTGLDSLTERSVMDEFFQYNKDRTAMVITHKLTGLERMDEILVLDRGRIVERGNHKELLRQGGLYRQMWLKATLSESPSG